MNITAADFEKLGFWEDDTPEEKITVYGMDFDDAAISQVRFTERLKFAEQNVALPRNQHALLNIHRRHAVAFGDI